MRTIIMALIITGGTLLGGCASNISPNTYGTTEVGVASRVDRGVVVARRLITIDNNSGVGSIAGATAGAAAGTMVGGNSATNVVGAVGGAVAAGVVGHKIDAALNRQQGYEYIIKLDKGTTVAITQAKNVQLAVGQRVLVLYGAMTRIIPDATSTR